MPAGDRPPASRRSPEALAARRARRAAIDDPSVVLRAAAALLDARQRTVAELRARLVALGYAPTLAEGAVARLVELRYLDDEAYARAWVESRDRARPRGARALRLELTRRGIEPALAERVLAERASGPVADAAPAAAVGSSGAADEAAAERLLARRSAALLREPDPRRRRARAYALLARNGFDPDTCATVSRRVAADDDGADGGEPGA